MIVVIASENYIPNEFDILRELFEQGLTHFHLRKPEKSIEEYRKYLDKIDKKYHSRIVLHQYHELRQEFDLKGIHLQEQTRREVGTDLESFVEIIKRSGFSVSSSFHELKELKECSAKFDYHLLSPVFSSISKQGYEGRGFDVNSIDKGIIGMGGINASTVKATIKLGYKGVGVLGGIWNDENPIKSFLAIKKEFENRES
ncbi:MAG: thiamine phosphate synthase [Crocinitomicaceae bacterium]|nr:thiamine phosphate synthase [Crocinitomicaceae bacterium]